MILPLYIARRFASMFLRVLLVFFGIMILIDIIDHLRVFSGKDIGLDVAARLALMNVPESLYRVLPLIMIMSAIALFLGLARSSELVVVRAAGRSGLRFLVAPLAVALIIGLFTISVLNPLVAATSREYERLLVSYGLGGGSALSVADSGLWLRQGAEDGQTVIQAARANLDGTELFSVTFLTFNADGLPLTRIEADSAHLIPGAWAMSNAKTWNLTAPNPEATASLQALGATLPSDLTVDRIRDSFGTPSAIPFWQLSSYIEGLEKAGFSARAHRLWLQMELAQPLLMAAMVLIAAGFTMRHVRFGKTGTMVLFAILTGFAVFFLRNFSQSLGANGQIPILLAAWSPPVASVLMSIGLLLHLEDG